MKQKLMKVASMIKTTWAVCKALGYVFVWPALLMLAFISWCNDIIKGLNS